MSPLASLDKYLRAVQRRWQVAVAARGAGITGGAALALTLVCVAIANHFGFSDWSVIGGRTLLFGALVAIVAAVLVLPLFRSRRRDGASNWIQRLEKSVPAFDQRVRTFVDQKTSSTGNPIVELLAEDTLRLAADAPPARIAASRLIWTFAGVGLAAVVALIWLGVAGPGYLGYGTARLWAGWLKPKISALYQILVEPGSTTIRRRADLPVNAKTVGFYSPTARIYVRFASSAKWEETLMHRRPDDAGFEFIFSGVEEPLRYYIAAGGVKTEEYEVRVVEMPNVKKLRLTYRYPSWTGKAPATEEPGGDVRAVAGTEVEVEVETDRPLDQGLLRLNNQSNQSMKSTGNWSRAKLAVDKDGQYHIAALHNGEMVRLTDDFFIEAVPDRAPTLKLARPGRDYRASPIEEVTAQIQAEDDFGLRALDLRYSVNGEPEKVVSLAGPGRESSGSHTFALETYSLSPGDVVSYYAVARDAKVETKTDIYFIEVQPFEREFYQSQQMPGGGGGGGEDESSRISRRQKEIVAATWNLAREKSLDKQKAAEHAKTLSGIQSKLRDQARTLAQRMKARQLAGVNNDFKTFVENMEKAAAIMEPATEKLSAQKWEEALQPEQKALQHLQRAESIFRQIQVAFGNQGGGGGNSGRDLAEMFDIELDIEKNQYETGRQASAQERDRELDEAAEKLRELARRQEQLAEQQRRQQTASFDQRWRQEMLRREAEDLARRIEQMQQRAANQSSSGQQQQQQQGQGGQQSAQQSGSPGSAQLQRTLERLQQAARDMQAANGTPGQTGETPQQQAAARQRALERLREAEEMMSGARRESIGEELAGMERRAGELAGRQQAVANKLREGLRQSLERQGGSANAAPSFPRDQAQALAGEKDRMLAELQALEKSMQDAARRLAANQPKASQRLRETLSAAQQSELSARLRVAADGLRRGYGFYVAQREEPVSEALNQLRQGVEEARRLAQGEGGDQNLERALNRVERLRQQLEQAMAAQRDRAQGQQGQGQEGQQGQQGQQGAGEGQNGSANAGGERGGQFSPRGGPRTGTNYGGGPWNGGPHDYWRGPGDATNRGDWQPGRLPSPEEAARLFRDGRVELSQIERALRSDPELARDVEALRKEMRELDNVASRFPGNPALLNREQQKLLHEVEQLELTLRRKLEQKQGAQVRAGAEQPIPQQYRQAVAEYFRQLSRDKPGKDK